MEEMEEMEEIKIDTGVPMPKVQKRPSKYPWKKMDIGDSFFVEKPSMYKGNIAPISSVGTFRFKPKRFIQRREGNGLRVWRVE